MALMALQTNRMTSSRRICPLLTRAAGAQNAGERTEMYMSAWADPDSGELVVGCTIDMSSQTQHAISQGRAGNDCVPGPRRPRRQITHQATSAVTRTATR